MDNLTDAQRYREQCVKHRKQCPTIVTMDGHTLSGDGLLSPRNQFAEKGLVGMFGAMPAKKRPDYRLISDIEREAAALYDTHSEFAKAKDAHARANEDLEEKQPQLQVMQQKCEKAMRDLQRYKDPEYSPPTKRFRAT